MPDNVRDLINGIGHYLGPLVGTIRSQRFLGRRIYRSDLGVLTHLEALVGSSSGVSDYSMIDMAAWASLTYQLDFGESPGQIPISALVELGFTEFFNTDDSLELNASGFDAIVFRDPADGLVIAVEGSTSTTDWFLNLATITGASSTLSHVSDHETV